MTIAEQVLQLKEQINRLRRIHYDIDESDEITGVKTISIVEDPAIGSKFILLNKDKHHREKMFVRLLLLGYEVGDFKLIDRSRGKRARETFRMGLRLLHHQMQLQGD